MQKYSFILLINILIQPIFVTAQADWKDNLNETWKNTKDLSENAVDKSKEFSDRAVQGSKNIYNTLSGDISLIPIEGVTDTIIIEENTQHLKNIWPNVLENLDDALNLNTKIDKAPASRWFGADKKSLAKDQFEVFSEIEQLLDSPAISRNRKNINHLRDEISSERQDIAKLKEKRIIASSDEKEKLDKKIQKSLNKINAYSNNIDQEKNNLKARLQKMGLLLSNDQIDVLLSRVDSDDIIRMSVVYDVLADITKQLMELTQEFNEDINQARKYYGMHVVLLKFVINMQQSYIIKLEKEYLPKIEHIKNETRQVNQESKALLRTENNSVQRKVLRNNLKAQQLTLKVSKLYAQQLQKQKRKVQEALNQATKDYLVAKNTFDTVKLSAELIRLMKSNQASFNALMNIQIPEIVPFKNIEMQKKFEELSLLLKG